jgi:murein DD-endopeptidase MepM/ murein hydrolase activator NlpD
LRHRCLCFAWSGLLPVLAVLAPASGWARELQILPAPAPAPVPVRVPVAQLVQDDHGPSRLSGALDEQVWSAIQPVLGYPLAVPALQIDPWGWRYSESRGAWRMHTGVDFAAAAGTPVLASAAGRVVLAEALSGYGLTVVLDHGQGLLTLYAHLQVIGVTVGNQIDQGSVLGQVGMTGVATGPHLHFELRSLATGALAHDPTPHLPPLLPPPALTASRPLP